MQTVNKTGIAYLVPHNVRLHSRLYIILNARAGDVFALA